MPGKRKARAKSAKKAPASARAGKGRAAKRGAGKKKAGGRRKNIGEMRELLLVRRDELLQGMDKNLTYQSAPSAAKGDSSDLASNALDSDTAMQLVESGSSELAQIDEALRKIEESTYGNCEVCGGEIPWGRLEAVPYATLCVTCKEKQERTGSAGISAAGWSAVDELETLERDL